MGGLPEHFYHVCVYIYISYLYIIHVNISFLQIRMPVYRYSLSYQAYTSLKLSALLISEYDPNYGIGIVYIHVTYNTQYVMYRYLYIHYISFTITCI